MNWYNDLYYMDEQQLDKNFLSMTFNAASSYDKEFMYVIIIYYSALNPDVKIDFIDMKSKGIKLNLENLPPDLTRLLSNFVHHMNKL